MWGKRSRETEIPCEKCGQKLVVRRQCRQIDFVCPTCGDVSDIKKHLHQLDDELEDFIASANMDRV